MKNITEQDDTLIRNIGNVQSVTIQENQHDDLIPLSNGYCTKNSASGLCDHAFACYTCRMYRPSKDFLHVYKNQLCEAERNIKIAKLNGFERFMQINTDLKEQLVTIISKITGGINE